MVCYRFVIVDGVAYGEEYRFGFCGGNVLGRVTGKTGTGGGVKLNQVKRLGCIQCFNVSGYLLTGYLQSSC